MKTFTDADEMHANILAVKSEMLNSLSLFAFPSTPQPETEQGRRTSLEKFTRSVVSVLLLPKLHSSVNSHITGSIIAQFQ